MDLFLDSEFCFLDLHSYPYAKTILFGLLLLYLVRLKITKYKSSLFFFEIIFAVLGISVGLNKDTRWDSDSDCGESEYQVEECCHFNNIKSYYLWSFVRSVVVSLWYTCWSGLFVSLKVLRGSPSRLNVNGFNSIL